MNYKKLSHVVWDCKYHLVVVPKYRYKVFDQEVRKAVKEELKKPLQSEIIHFLLRHNIAHSEDIESSTCLSKKLKENAKELQKYFHNLTFSEIYERTRGVLYDIEKELA